MVNSGRRIDRRLLLILAATGAACLSVAMAAAPAAGRGGVKPGVSVGSLSQHLVRLPGEMVPGLSRLIARGTLRPVATTEAQLGQLITVTITLRRSREAAFARFLAAVTNPRSPEYGHYLTQRQLANRFGPTLRTYDAVQRWLVSKGLRIVQRSANRLTLSARATRAEVARAFATPIKSFRVGHVVIHADTSAPALPRALAGQVEAVSGLSDLAVPRPPLNQWQCNQGYPGPYAGQPNGGCGNLCQQAMLDNSLPGKGVAPLGSGLPGQLFLLFSRVMFAIGALPATDLGGGGSLLLAPQVWGYCLGASNQAASPGQPNWFVQHFGYSKSGLIRLRPRATRRIALASGAGNTTAPQKVGLLEFDGFHTSDVTDWVNMLGIDPSVLGELSQVNVNGGVPTPGGGESEVLLDIDAVLAGTSQAPATKVVVYDAPPTTSFSQLFQAMINDGDTVISNSWSQCEDETPQADAQAIDSVLESAAAGGVSVLNGTGDSGSTCLDGSPNTIGVPADSPHATAVGGTTPAFGPGLTYGSEAWWNAQGATPPGGAGGYGVSRYFTRPSYQDGLTSSPMRSVPDLSFTADPAAGISICQADNGGCPVPRIGGGTSLAAPAVAALVADLNQGLDRNLGDLNPALYPLAGTTAFHSAASLGSDFAHVGLGSPNFTAIGEKLAGASPGVADPSLSDALPLDQPQGDGNEQGMIRVDLVDANGLPVSGKTVTLTPSSSTASVLPASATTDAGGSALFDVTDSTPEPVTFTVTDTTDSVTLNTQPEMTFTQPVATGGVITATPKTVTNDGTSQTTISVYLQNDLGRPAVGKTVSLSAGGSAQVTPVGSSPGPNEAVTDSTGTATFTATDTAQETVQFTATDVSDGNLPVPGSAVVTFEPSGSAGCSDLAPTPVSGYTISTWASGIPYDPQPLSGPGGFTLGACYSMNGLTFDSSGNPYFADSVSGEIYRLGPAGGTVTQADSLPDTPEYSHGDPTGIAFGSAGDLFVAQVGPQIEELDPATGQLERIAATGGGGDHFCGWGMATDPLSGDIFHTDFCNGSVASGVVTRLSGPEGPSPSWTDYADTGGSPVGQLAFAPDGTMYVAVNGSDSIVSVSGTNGASPPTVTTLASLPNAPYGIAVASSDAGGHATALYVTDSGGNIDRIDLTQSPATVTPIASGGSGSLGEVAVGPDGCLYVRDLDRILKVSGPGCAAASPTPEITLSQTSGSQSPPTGSQVGLTAALQNFSSPAGTAVHFDISGPNVAPKLADANASGTATVSYAGTFQGIDTITAWALDNGKLIASAPVEVHWMPGVDTSFLTLNNTPETGSAGNPVTLVANLTDVTQSPVSAIAGAPVTLSLGGQSCTATTDSSGKASCQVTPAGNQGLESVIASYPGDSSHTSATASNLFELGGVGVAAPGSSSPPPGGNPLAPTSVARPKISGTPLPGDRLRCSSGSWSNSPTSFTYQWERDGRPIPGATGESYSVQISDRAHTLTCAVSASNAAGSATATSAGVLVALPGTLRCPRARGRLAGATLGPLRLGMTRRQARGKLRRFHVFSGFDDFCQFAGWGIRTGYPSARLLNSLPRRERARLAGRIVIALTGNPFYALRGVAPGMPAGMATKRLHLRRPFRIGVTWWYFVAVGKATGILKVSHGVVQEVGVIDRLVTRNRKAEAFLLGSWGRLPWGRQPP